MVKQDISKISNSEVNQAGRDLTIVHGLGAADVIAIVKEVVASELSVYTQDAERKAQERVRHFSDTLVKALAEKVSEQLDRFNEPSLQYALREATLSYVKSGKPSDENALIDLMIERVKAEEHTTKQKLIDQAIKIIPQLSAECIAFLSLLVFRSLSLSGDRINLEKWFDTVNPLLDIIQNVTDFDIEYLKQADCTTGLTGIMGGSWMESCISSYDLFFRHPVPYSESKAFMDKYGIVRFDNGFTMNQSPTALPLFVMETLEFQPDDSIRFRLVNKSMVEKLVADNNLSHVKNDVDHLIEVSKPYTQEEVKDYFISRNANWSKAIELLESNRARASMLLPVGIYIGCRQLSLLSGRDISMDTFYGKR